eukprot:jgi/Ulvmu1/3567/UM167_0001.1
MSCMEMPPCRFRQSAAALQVAMGLLTIAYAVAAMGSLLHHNGAARPAYTAIGLGEKDASHSTLWTVGPVGPSRGLLQNANSAAPAASAAADITVVTTAAQFQAAVMSGAQDIELREHLDLGSLALAFNSNTSLSATVLGDVKASTRSIRGNCQTAPPAASTFGLPAPDFLWTAPQCVIVSDHNFFVAYNPLWLDALHLRRRPSTWYLFHFLDTKADATLYGTGLTIQGNGALNTSVLYGDQGSQAIFQGCVFDSVGGENQIFFVDDASVVISNATLSNLQQRNSFIEYVASSAEYRFTGVVAVSGAAASATVLDSKFENVAAVNLFWTLSDGAVIADGLMYSNVTTERNQWNAAGAVVGTGDGTATVKPFGKAAIAPSGVAALNSLPFSAVPQLAMDDPWITSTQQAITEATPAQTQTAPDPPPNPLAAPALGVAGDAAPSVAAVYTAFELQDAFHEGVRDIEIYEHLDLRNLARPWDPIVRLGSSLYPYQIGYAGTPTRSIRGKCTAPPAGLLSPASLDLDIEDEEPWARPRCVIITSEDLFIIDRSRLWLDSLHIQIIDGTENPVPVWPRSWGQAYVTNTVVQGDRSSNALGIEAFRGVGGLYAEGCVFNALQGDDPYERAILVLNSNAYFNSCTFRGLSNERLPETAGQWSNVTGALQVVGVNATLALENCTLANIYNSVPIVISRGGLLYSDNAQHVGVEFFDLRSYPPLPLEDLANRTARTPPPLQASDPWFVSARQTLASPPASAYLSAYPLRPNSAPAAAPAPDEDPVIDLSAPPKSASPVSAEPDTGSPSVPAEVPTDSDIPTDSETVDPNDSQIDPDLLTIPPAEGDDTGGGDDDGGPSVGLIVGIAVAVVAVLAVCVVVALFALAKKRKKRRAASPDAATPQTNEQSQGAAAQPTQQGPAAANATNHASAFGPGGPMGSNHYNPGFHPGGHPPPGMYHGQYLPGHPYGYHLAHPSGQQMYGGQGGPGYHPQGAVPGYAEVAEGHPGAGGGDANQMGTPRQSGGDPRQMGVPLIMKGGGPAGGSHHGSSHGSTHADRGASLHASTATLTNITRLTWSDFQKAGGEAGSPVEELQVALDAMNSMQAPFYHRYMMLSAVDRRVGGQGIVQFASIANTLDRAAIKFYIDHSAFERERELYTESQLKAMMPATLAVLDNANGDIQTPYGYVFPPFVIIECGQSLDEWARDNANKDFITIFQALSHAVRALRKLHDFGYAHRDVKPGNILRRPKQHDWTLIDFGCTALIGSTASLSFSLKYAAPEVVHALEAGSKTIHVDAAVDMWAVGVIAFELLTGERAFPTHNMSAAESEQAAQDAIAGRAPLLWEGPSDATRERLEKLRGMRRTVLRCLDRDPVKRPTAAALVQSWDHTFDNMQTRGTDWSARS